jgi:hypothetical protein
MPKTGHAGGAGEITMGAWDSGPFDSDNAMEWVDNDVTPLLLRAIRSKLIAFIEGGFADDVEKDQAKAAVGLIVLLSRPPESEGETSCPINLFYQAKEDDTFRIAIAVVNLLLADHTWIEAWSHPDKARAELEQLLMKVRRLEDAPTPI